jgi:hypothetical protein
MLFALPPIVTNTYVGMREVDRDDRRGGARHGDDRQTDPEKRRAAAGDAADLTEIRFPVGEWGLLSC